MSRTYTVSSDALAGVFALGTSPSHAAPYTAGGPSHAIGPREFQLDGPHIIGVGNPLFDVLPAFGWQPRVVDKDAHSTDAVAARPAANHAQAAPESGGLHAPNLPTDNLFSSQYYLRNTAGGQRDLHMFQGNTALWDDYDGHGVHVALIDDGVDYNHPDLNNNYDASRETIDGFHPDAGDAHGTATSGIICAERDGSGTVGVAYGAHFTMMAAISNAPNISIEDAFANYNNFDVINNSWGWTSAWYDQFFNPAQTAAYGPLFDMSEFGRGGLGTVFVKSAGNGRGSANDNTVFQYMDSHWATVCVAAVNRDGTVSSYSTEGAGLLVSAFGGPIPGDIVTTDRTVGGYDSGNYTSTFNGTSSAAPMVTGIVALMLDANPDLGYRDVQEILAATARHTGSAIGSGLHGSEHYAWAFNASGEWNGGGMHYSEDYGYGLVDALAAVRLAETWTQQSTRANLDQFDPTSTDFTSPLTIADLATETVHFTLASGMRIEQVAMDMGISHTFTADLDIMLTSPTGTVSHILQDNGAGTDIPDYGGTYDVTLVSNAFRGEDSGGVWTLTITDDAAMDTGSISAIGFYITGDAAHTDDTFVFTDEYSDYANPARKAIADTDGGNDTLNAAAVFTDSTINLASGGTIDGVNFTTNGSVENAVGGDGDDTLTGTNAANSLSGVRGHDKITGKGGADTLEGGDGQDALNGGKGNDEFVYASANDSTSKTYDTVTKADFTHDAFDVKVAVTGIDATIATGALSKASFNSDLAAAANAAHLGANHAVLFTPTSGSLSGKMFMVVDQNGVAGYQQGADLVMLLNAANHIGDLGASDFT